MTEIRAVFFDLVGTLLVPVLPASEVYAAAGRQHGSRLGPSAIAERFREALSREDSWDRVRGWAVNEDREIERWRRIVATVIDDVRDAEGCFRTLYRYFAQPEAWRCLPGAGEVIARLARRGLTLGVATNFDRRLYGVVAGFPELAPLRQVVVGSEVGWRKPAPEFFAAVVRAAACPPEGVLMVGDDRVNDYDGALAAGLRAVLFDPAGRYAGLDRVGSWEELRARFGN
ncbi:MAG: HAD family hydrolase [Gemmataceae bacterium]|nr:HAD family hydrolase [Gemmataceae bacterium]MDW8266147.1 HAD-IA family hydrolase [Gemmataceae bacterium]